MATWETPNTSTCQLAIFLVNSDACFNFPSYFIISFLCVILFLGLPANCYVMWLSVKEMIRGQSTEIFVFNVAIVEVIFYFSFVFYIQVYFFNCMDCEFGLAFFVLVLWVGRPLFMSCICVERYLAVLHPLIFLKLKPMKYRIACSAVGWILIIVLCASNSWLIDTLYNALLFEFIVILTIKLYTCLMVLKALVRPGPGDNISQKEAVNKDKIKAFRIIQIVLLTSLFMNGPMIISLVLYHIMDLEKFLLLWCIALCIGLTSGFVQPLHYLKRVGKLPFC